MPSRCHHSPLASETQQDSVNWPNPGRTLCLIDPESLQPVLIEQASEVQIFDLWMFDGYRQTDQATDAYTPDGWLRTGDLGCGPYPTKIKLES